MSQIDPELEEIPFSPDQLAKARRVRMVLFPTVLAIFLLFALFLWWLSRLPTDVRSFRGVASGDWHGKVAEEMPLLGHRNWILIVDSAYPLQTSPGIETIETHESQEEVVESVLKTIHDSIRVRPVIYMDAELSQIPEADAPGVTAYRGEIGKLLDGAAVNLLPHEQLIGTVDEAGKTFHILVLKTNMTVPYTSVFVRLDCKYWSADAETRLRTRMENAVKP